MIVVPTRHVLAPRDRFGIIFVDCWESDWTWQGDTGFYQTIKNHVARLPVGFKVFHTTYLRPDIVGLDVLNYCKTFIEEHPDKIRGLRDFLDNIGNHLLSTELWELLDNKSMLIPSLGAFSDLVEILGIKHWIIMGAHWNFCIHDKPLGLNNLKILRNKHPDIEFYVDLECVARWKQGPDSRVAAAMSWQDLYDDHLSWSRDQRGLARLEPVLDLTRKPRIAIFTNWPEDIVNASAWEIVCMESNQALIDTISPDRPSMIEHLVYLGIREKGHREEHVLYVATPGKIDLGRLLWISDHDHSAFVDRDYRFVLARPHGTWRSCVI